jgi:putative transposase
MLNLPRSSYYYKCKEENVSNQIEEANLRDHIEQIICKFPGYGSRRVTKHLRREGVIINRKRIQRIMRENSLLCAVKRKWTSTTNSHHSFKRYPNLIKDLIVEQLNQLWVADITYIRIMTTFVYLAVILDALSRKAIGFALSKTLKDDLTLRALRMAIAQRNAPSGCIHHSDQGVQYASNAYVNELKEHNFQISMASKGNPYENAIAESFIKTLKYEEVYLWDYQTVDDVVQRLPFFIQQVYNQKRLHSAIDYVPPVEFEASFINKELFQSSCQLVPV